MATAHIIDHVAGAGTTVSIASVDIITYTPPNSSVCGILLTAVGKSSAATPLVCTRAMSASVRKSSTGVLTVVNTTQLAGFTDLVLLATNVTLVASGGSLIVRVNGALLGTDLTWWADLWVSIN
jgi:hypothetical protein